MVYLFSCNVKAYKLCSKPTASLGKAQEHRRRGSPNPAPSTPQERPFNAKPLGRAPIHFESKLHLEPTHPRVYACRKDVNESLMWPLTSKLAVTFQICTEAPKPSSPGSLRLGSGSWCTQRAQHQQHLILQVKPKIPSPDSR